MADLSISAGDMCDRIEAITGNAAAGNALAHLNRGYMRVLAGIDPRDPEGEAHAWTFLRPVTTITFWATTTGTASGAPAKTNGTSTVTATAATFYASMVGKSIVFTDTSNSYVIASYTSSTVVVVTGDASGESDADTMTITANGTYPLPDDFGGMVENFTYTYSATEALSDFEEVSPQTMDELQRDSESTGTSVKWTVVPRSIVTTGQKFDVVTYPTTDTTRTVRYRYKRRPDVLTDSTSVYSLGGPIFNRAVEIAGLAEMELHIAHTPGIYGLTLYPEAIEGAIDDDISLYGSDDVPVMMSEV